jgi:hypothetical protein
MKAALSLAALLLFVAPQLAPADGDGCCTNCGRNCRVKPVCRIVCEMKEVKEWVYECECEDFCVPGPGKKVGCYCDQDPNCPCKCESKPIYKPCWCEMFHRKKLIKKEVVKQVPTYKCVVEYVCVECCNQGNCRQGHCDAEANQNMAEADHGVALRPLPVPAETPLAEFDGTEEPVRHAADQSESEARPSVLRLLLK